MPKAKTTTASPESLTLEAIEKLNKEKRSLAAATARFEAARERVLTLLPNFNVVTCHPVIRHHIINTECRRLTPEEITQVYRPES